MKHSLAADEAAPEVPSVAAAAKAPPKAPAFGIFEVSIPAKLKLKGWKVVRFWEGFGGGFGKWCLKVV